MRKNYLLTPGPTPLPPQVCEAMARPIIHHRTPQFQAILKEASEGLKYVFETKNDVFILTSSGTGAMEAAVVNILSPGDTAIAVQGGKFGERWTEICQSYGINAEVINVEWGRAVDPKEIEKKLKANPKIKAVFTTLCETSTGVVTDIEAIGKVVNRDHASVMHGIKSVNNTFGLRKKYNKFFNKTETPVLVKKIKEPIKEAVEINMQSPFNNIIPANNREHHGYRQHCL